MLLALTQSTTAQTWTPNPKVVTGKKETAKGVQCYGTTKKGERCKMHGQPDKTGKYFCRFHKYQQDNPAFQE